MILMVVSGIIIAIILILSVYWICTLTGHDKWMEKYQHDWIKAVVCLIITAVSIFSGYAIGIGF